MKQINFTKMVGSGNDFIVIDNRKRTIPDNIARFVRRICQRRFSIGADGVILIEDSNVADFKLRIFNPDGYEPSMCGNGARCAALFAFQMRIAGSQMDIETKAGIHSAAAKRDRVKLTQAQACDYPVAVRLGGREKENSYSVKLKLPGPMDIKKKISLKLDRLETKFLTGLGGKSINAGFINTGVPHVVCFVRNVDKINVEAVGAKIRHHKEFRPEGTNANFVQKVSENRIKVRTYERGVETETLSCGTGSVASAIIFAINRQTSGKKKELINVQTKSGELLKVYFNLENDRPTNLCLEGKVKEVCRGVIRSTT